MLATEGPDRVDPPTVGRAWAVIGVIRSPFTQAVGTPIQPPYAGGAAGEVVLAPPFDQALDDIEGFERVWLVYWLDRADRYRAHVTPYRDTRPHGLFATRAPARPNPIGISAVRLLRRAGPLLHVADLDVLDGTPLLDIKPYVPLFDAFPGARAGWLDEARMDRQAADDRFHSSVRPPEATDDHAIRSREMTCAGRGFGTQLVHAGAPADAYGSAVTPIYQTSTFRFHDAQEGADRFAGQAEGYIYTRLGNPTVHALEAAVAALEEGAGGIATSSGMGAVMTAYIALLGQGQHIVSTASVYGPSRCLLESHMARFGVAATFVDTAEVANVAAALRPETRVVYIETPSNPAMQVTDIRAVAELAHAHGCLLVVDNTFASPYLQQPLNLGADVVLHSVTKFINGHADVVGGVLVAREADLVRRLRAVMIATGCNMDPHQAFLVRRGLKTLGLRLERAQSSALQIAAWLESRPEVAWVRYVGLPSHPQHQLAMRQMRGPGAMIAFELHGGLAAGRRLMDRVRLATLAVSLGGVETLIEHPASMTHAGMARADRLEAGITDGLVRYAVGIEDPDDLIADLAQALAD